MRYDSELVDRERDANSVLRARIKELEQRLAAAEASREAYRQAGARLLQAFQKRFCFIEDTMEDCLKTVDMEVEIAEANCSESPNSSGGLP